MLEIEGKNIDVDSKKKTIDFSKQSIFYLEVFGDKITQEIKKSPILK